MRLQAIIDCRCAKFPKIELDYVGLIEAKGEFMENSHIEHQARALAIANEEIIKAIERSNNKLIQIYCEKGGPA